MNYQHRELRGMKGYKRVVPEYPLPMVGYKNCQEKILRDWMV